MDESDAERDDALLSGLLPSLRAASAHRGAGLRSPSWRARPIMPLAGWGGTPLEAEDANQD
jgi:hypothetical protein